MTLTAAFLPPNAAGPGLASPPILFLFATTDLDLQIPSV